MSERTVTIRLGGSATVDEFAARAGSWSNLLRALADESGVGRNIRWVITDLEYSSAILTAMPVAETPEAESALDRVVDNYLEAARGLKSGHNDRRRSLELVRELVESATPEAEVTFETPEADVTFLFPEPSIDETSERVLVPVLGTVRGRVQTLSQRWGLRFTLWDLVSDRAVSCYIQPEREELLRNVWGHLADVTGVVSRDPRTDRPISIRRVSEVVVIPENEAGAYRMARGSVDAASEAPPSEEIIRRLRDAG